MPGTLYSGGPGPLCPGPGRAPITFFFLGDEEAWDIISGGLGRYIRTLGLCDILRPTGLALLMATHTKDARVHGSSRPSPKCHPGEPSGKAPCRGIASLP